MAKWNRRFASVSCLFAGSLLAFHSPLLAGRTAIDQDDDGNPTTTYLSGYCDLDGSDCIPSQLSYEVSFGSGAFSNLVTVHGNGLVSFGGSIDFSPFVASIQNGDPIDPASYGVNLVDAGQHNETDFMDDSVFFQSAELFLRANGVIDAQFFTCVTPQFCRENPYGVTLTPTLSGPSGQSGFFGIFDFSQGQGGSDVGFVVDGVFYATDDRFFLPALFRGFNDAGVPEPGTWLMLVLGFGLLGSGMRRRTSARMDLREQSIGSAH